MSLLNCNEAQLGTIAKETASQNGRLLEFNNSPTALQEEMSPKSKGILIPTKAFAS